MPYDTLRSEIRQLLETCVDTAGSADTAAFVAIHYLTTMGGINTAATDTAAKLACAGAIDIMADGPCWAEMHRAASTLCAEGA